MRWAMLATATRRLLGSSPALGLLLTVLTWPYPASARVSEFGLDPSWQAALQMAAQQRLPFGTHVAFAYGPLGFLSVVPVYGDTTAVLGWLYLVGLAAAVFTVLVWALRPRLPLLVALAVAYLVGEAAGRLVLDNFTGGTERATAVTFAVCVALLTRAGKDQPPPAWAWPALGAAASWFFLIKAGVGAQMGLLVLVTAVSAGAGVLRRMLLLAAGVLPAFAVGWLATGNGLSNLPVYARSTSAIVTGYAAAVSIEQPGRGFAYLLAAADVAVVVAFAVLHARGLPRRTRWGLGVLTGLALWLLFKEGFVRHDHFHDVIFFAAVPILLVCLLPLRPRATVSLVALTAVITVEVVAGGGPAGAWQRPDLGPRQFLTHAADVLAPGRRHAVTAESQRALRVTYAVPEDMLALLAGQTVSVDPFEQAVALAYPELRFDPLPGLQAYSTYTSSLDRQDVRYLRSGSAPRYLLRQQPTAFDDRDPVFEPPGTQVEIACRYHQVLASSAWQLLEIGPNRCGTPRLIGSISTGLEQWVPVPSAPAGSLVVADFDLPLSGWWHARAMLFKPPQVHLTVDGGRQTYRFIAGTASSLHLLSAPPGLGYSPPFAPPAVGSLSFSIDGRGPGASGVGVRFYAIPLQAG